MYYVARLYEDSTVPLDPYSFVWMLFDTLYVCIPDTYQEVPLSAYDAVGAGGGEVRRGSGAYLNRSSSPI